MPRCTVCRRPMRLEYVELPRIGLDNRPVQYRNVRRYACPEGCRGVRLDFSEAKPVDSGVRPKVIAEVKPLKKEPDFNDRLLAVGLLIGYAILVVSFLAIPMALELRLAAIAAVSVSLLATYRFATQRVVLPTYFPVPLPPQRIEPVTAVPKVAEPVKAPAKAAAAAAVATATAPVAAPAGSIAMKVLVGGEEHQLAVNAGENMLDAALDRNVAIDFSCREGLCDSCVVKVLSGTENITEPTPEEIDMLGDEVKNGLRLSCQVKVNGPVVIQQE